jgi:FtsZ-binding cell division protein ZapB
MDEKEKLIESIELRINEILKTLEDKDKEIESLKERNSTLAIKLVEAITKFDELSQPMPSTLSKYAGVT